MSVNVVLNSVTYSIPEPGDTGWGQDLTNYFVAQASGLLQKAGGPFTLTAEVDFGATYGLKSAYFKSRTTNAASAGQLRLANADLIDWRNFANDGNLTLGVNSSDLLVFNGTAIQPAGNYITALTGNVTASGPGSAVATIAPSVIVNSMISASAAIAYSKLALTGSIVNADISASAAIAYSKLALTGSIVNADISASAAITFAKLVSVTGDISISSAGVSAYVSTVPLNKGGTGQTTKSAAFDALSPMSASGDIVYGGASGTGTRLPKGSDGQVLTLASGIPSWSAIATTAPLAKSANYSLAAADGTVDFTTGASALTATLPTAVGAAGKRYTINKVDASTGYVTLATTSSQTVGGLATSVIRLSTINDVITVESDNANWQIVVFNVSVSFVGTTTGQTPAALNGTTPFALTLSRDTQGGFNGANTYVVKIPGDYYLVWNASNGVSGSSGANALIQAQIFKNSTAILEGRNRNQAAVSLNDWPVIAAGVATLASGDSITVNTNTNFTTPGTTASGTLSIAKIG